MHNFPFNIANNAIDFDRETKDIRRFAPTPRPQEGWIRKTRKAIGMTGLQLATRMKTQQPHISELEKFEREGSATLRKMDEAAKAMGCQFVYAIVPEGLSASAMVEKRAALMTKKLYEKEVRAGIFSGDREYTRKLRGNKERYKKVREIELLQTIGLLWKDEWIKGV